jgi:uncharacterized membrane protein
MDLLIQLFGRFHPLVVHLPIGILFLAFLFECLSKFKRFKDVDQAVQPSILIGSVFAVVSVVTGLCLSEEGGYEDALLTRHQNIGIATTLFTVFLYFIRPRASRFFIDGKKVKSAQILMFIPVVVLLSITGHLGGSMTHGEDYLFESLSSTQKVDPMENLRAISNPDEAMLYKDIVEPILDSKCYSCHSSQKKKGDLRLDQVEFIMSGGKHGAILQPGNPDSSSLYSRLVLPMEHEEHMPPNERPQLSSSETSIIKSWIEDGASFDKKVNAFAQSTRIKTYLNALLAQLQQEPLIPVEEVSAADREALRTLENKGITILPVGTATNYLSVSFMNARSVTDRDLELLLPLKKQLLWLNVGRTKISDEGVKIIAQLPALRQIHFNHTSIGDDGIKHLTSLGELNYLNLVGTKITDIGLSHLSSMKKLKNIFLYETGVSSKGIEEFSTRLPDARVDTGGYKLPTLPSDTVVFKRNI